MSPPDLRDHYSEDDELTVARALVLTDPAQTLNAGKLVVEIRWYDDGGPGTRRRMTIGGPLSEQVSMKRLEASRTTHFVAQ